MQGVLIRVRGRVQGVGFRPHVWRLASDLGLSGQVLNDAEGVLIRVGGDGSALVAALRADIPPLARVDSIEVTPTTLEEDEGFSIVDSGPAGANTAVTPDAATCPDCLAEIRDPDARRYGYAFANCTHCGPRFTIVNGLPYDRARTAMAGFAMCPACRAEYENPADRRFHAQPIACPDCGPRLWLEPGHPDDSIAEAARRLRAGQVLAIKGLGGFHLAVDALNPDAVALLRTRKRRPAKPFALMGTEAMIASLSPPDRHSLDRLRSPAAPVVLIAGTPPTGIAPGLGHIGWMLPYTPLHHLLLDAFGGPLVMTSGNLSGEPQVIGNDEARDKLAGFADAFVMHDRDIARRLDDSVERGDPPMVLRRARGQVPDTLPLPEGFEGAPQVIAFGGQMKGAICLIKGGQALLGHHLGDLDDALTQEAFAQAVTDYSALFAHRPQVAACDLHPDFHASRAAHDSGLPVTEVQHHHAHLAACLGDNGWPLEGGQVAGLILDGLGLGPDGMIWGGEVLLGDYRGLKRIAHLAPAPLIGGDRAQSEPWRNALVRLDAAGLSGWADELFAGKPLGLARQAAARGINAPMSSSAGRLFDAVAACLGICADGQSYEGEAAMRLEALANRSAPDEAAYGYRFGAADGLIDPTPVWADLQHDLNDGLSHEAISMRFHAGLAGAFCDVVRGLVETRQARAVALSGGCFQNPLLLKLCQQDLRELPVLIHHGIPANDGGLALGQALVAAARAVESD